MNDEEFLSPLRALVVDDEPAVRRLVVAALMHEGFQCETAHDGEVAAEMAAQTDYQLVVSDLAMPRRNGHSLIVDLLAKPNRPVVAVLTGVLEPRLAKDLMARGVDDIVFKPIEFIPFAAKMRSLVDRRSAGAKAGPTTTTSRPNASSRAPSHSLTPISSEDIEAKLRELSRLPPVSRTAVEVYQLTASPEVEVRRVAAAVQREPALVADVLRFANSLFYNPNGKQIVDVEDAVVRLGQKRVGDLALATATSAAITQETIPFMPLAPIWRKCLAAGICMEMLMEQSRCRDAHDGLFVTAVLHPMCRVMLANIFPEIYEQMIKQCLFTNKPLSELEQQLFPESVGAIAANVMASWNIPEEIHRPLHYATLPFAALDDLPQFMRHRVEFVKTAVFVGEVAAGHFENWDSIDIPPAAVLTRLGIQSLASLVRQCRDDLDAIANWDADQSLKSSAQPKLAERRPTYSVAYKRLNTGPFDFLPQILACADIQLISIAEEISTVDSRVLVNCLGTPVHQLIGQLRSSTTDEIVLFASDDQAGRLRQYGQVLVVPCSFGALKKACGADSAPPSSRAPARNENTNGAQTNPSMALNV